MSGVAVREYASAEEMLAAYRARKRPPAPVVRPKLAMPEPVKSVPAPAPAPKPYDDLAQYREAYANAIPQTAPSQIAKRIIEQVCIETGISQDLIKSPIRTNPVSQARQEAIWRIAADTTLSLPQIGRIFNRDHTTILHAIRRMNDKHDAMVRVHVVGCTPPEIEQREFEAEVYRLFKDDGLDTQQIARRLGKTQAETANALARARDRLMGEGP